MKCFILEDNPSLRATLKQILLNQGWQVQMSGSWKEAEGFVTRNEYDLFVLDLLIPDKHGFEILDFFLKIHKNSKTKFILISGLFDKSYVMEKISNPLKKQCVFLKKPILEKTFLNCLKDFLFEFDQKPSLFQFMFESGFPEKKIDFYLSQNQTFNAKDFIPVLFLAHLKKFTGDFEVCTDKNQELFIQFYRGTITKLKSNSRDTFFGNLLVDHGLSLQEEIQFFLKEIKTSKKYLGEALVQAQLLSPQMLSFILKEQIKIRISEVLATTSFKLRVVERSYELEDIDKEIDFNQIDFMEWLVDSLQTELNESDLNIFFQEFKNKQIQKSSKVNKILIHQRDFVNKYNVFFKALKENQSIESVINSSDKMDSLRFFYFGLLTKSIYFKDSENKNLYEKNVSLIVDSILNANPENFFDILNLPWKSSVEEVEKKYKYLIKKIHPDILASSAPQSLRKKYEVAFQKVTNSYQNLSEKKKREEYINQEERKGFEEVIQLYEEGIKLIRKKQYDASYKKLIKIEHHKQAPSNILLYILWAELKSEKTNLFENRTKAMELKKKIETCSISLRTSSLFWFVKGLFAVKIKQYIKAKEFFKKSLRFEDKPLEAKTEMILLESKIPKRKKNLFRMLFKKSS